MRHLDEQELIDVADGVRVERSARHLQSCEPCRRQVADLRAMMSAVSEVDVPEPSPLFWEHFSARVSEGIAEVPRRHSTTAARIAAWTTTWRVGLPAGALAAVIVAAIVTLGGPRTAESPAAGESFGVEAGATDALAPLAEDASLSLIADLAGDLDWDAAADAGLTTRDGAVDLVLLEMSADERLELQRLLKQELSGRSVL
jgi:hypothetical protein